MPRPRPTAAAALMLAMLTLCHREASAQDSLTGSLRFLMTNQAIPTEDFERDERAAQQASDTVTRLMLAELATMPLSTSASGFLYRVDPALGTFARASESFGPFYTERAQTAGRGQVSFGVAVQSATFEALDGRDLRDGRLVTTANHFRDEAAPFDVETLTLRLDSRTVTFVANVGVTDRLDIGAAVPLVSIALEGERVNVYRGTTLRQATATARATGFGDPALRAKYQAFGSGEAGVALIGEVRLPLGREEDLLGAGETTWRGVAIGSAAAGRLAVHGNLGATAGGVFRELTFRGAATLAATPRLTVIGELLGRRLSDVGPLALAAAPHPTIAGVDTLRLVSEPGSTRTTAAVIGAKWNVAGTWLVSGNMVLPLTDGGLRAKPMFVAGLDIAFPR